LKSAHNITNVDDITTVFSIEKQICSLLPLTEEQQRSPQDYGAVEAFRLRVMPVLGGVL